MIDIQFDGSDALLIPEGKYVAVCDLVETRNTPWGWKLVVVFRILGGEHNGEQIERYYNITCTAKSPVRGSMQWKVGAKTSYRRDYQRLFGKIDRNNRGMSPSRFVGKQFKIKVVTVKFDKSKEPLGEENHYSKVDRILNVME